MERARQRFHSWRFHFERFHFCGFTRDGFTRDGFPCGRGGFTRGGFILCGFHCLDFTCALAVTLHRFLLESTSRACTHSSLLVGRTSLLTHHSSFVTVTLSVSSHITATCVTQASKAGRNPVGRHASMSNASAVPPTTAKCVTALKLDHGGRNLGWLVLLDVGS